jgi:hypothetical protein
MLSTALALVALLVGCGTRQPAGPAAAGPTTTTASDPGTTGSAGDPSAQPSGGTAGSACPATAEYLPEPGSGRREAQGGGAGVTLWALLFLTGDKLTAGTETKIVWRMTGAGKLEMRATGPGGNEITPAWGPEGHGGSNWPRPGDEWGAGWLFPTAGCWTVHASRADGSTAQLVLRVAG